MKTIPSNRTAPVLNQMTAARCYSLDNYFAGADVSAPTLLDYLTRMARMGVKFKVSFDKASNKGRIKFHSNEWYDFEARGA